MAGDCSYCDAILIVSATSERQANAIARAIRETVRPNKKAALSDGSAGWALIDFGDVVVHVFTDEVRAYYDLDQLFKNARRVPIEGPAPSAAKSGPSALAQRRGRASS